MVQDPNKNPAPVEEALVASLRDQAARFAKSHGMPHHPDDIQPQTDGEPDMEPLGDMLFSPPKKGKTK